MGSRNPKLNSDAKSYQQSNEQERVNTLKTTEKT